MDFRVGGLCAALERQRAEVDEAVRAAVRDARRDAKDAGAEVGRSVAAMAERRIEELRGLQVTRRPERWFGGVAEGNQSACARAIEHAWHVGALCVAHRAKPSLPATWRGLRARNVKKGWRKRYP